MWYEIEINKQNIIYDTGKAVLIKMPNNSKYASLTFWHPKKLVRDGSNSYAVSISYNENFQFTLFKKGQRKYNRNEIISQQIIGIKDFEEAFECMENCTKAKSKESYLIVKEPEKVEKEIIIERSLLNE
nr:MAG TPA: hypothetical protein [Caudoviricetes sp.]